MPILCLLRRHHWRAGFDYNADRPFEVCTRCGHYRNDVKFRDLSSEVNWPPAGGPGSVM